jgi:hypothetical protein
VAQAGDEVILASGHYELSAPVEVDNVALRGSDPAHPAVLDDSVGSGDRAVSLGGFKPSLANVAIIGTHGTFGLYADVGGDVSNVTVMGTSDTECQLESHGDGTPGLLQNVTCVTSSSNVASLAARLATLPGWGPLTVRNCTFVNRNQLNAVWFDGQGTAGTSPSITITDSIVLSPNQAASTFDANTTVIASHNWMYDTYQQVSSDGTDISSPPPDLVYDTAAVHEQADSVTVDAGSTAGAAPDGIDYEGDLRTFGRAPDIGADELTGKPAAAVSPATAIRTTAATLNGRVTTGGEPASYHFEYGASASYGRSTPSGVLRGANGQTAVAAQVTGLPARSNIHYRLVVTTREGTVGSADGVFSAAVPPPPPASKLSHVVVSKHAVRYTLNRAATLKLRVVRVVKGHRQGKICSTRSRRGAPCVKLQPVVSKTIQAKAGAGTVSLPKLKKGSYRVTLTPEGGKPFVTTLKIA